MVSKDDQRQQNFEELIDQLADGLFPLAQQDPELVTQAPPVTPRPLLSLSPTTQSGEVMLEQPFAQESGPLATVPIDAQEQIRDTHKLNLPAHQPSPAVPQKVSAASIGAFRLADDGLPHLRSYQPIPRFDLETMVAKTGVHAMTLRTWERRYGVLVAWRGESNYPLYSVRDLMAARWLRRRMAAGLSIRQAMVELAGYEPEYVQHDGSNDLLSTPVPPRQDLQTLVEPLLRALTSLDEVGADRILANAFAAYPVGFVCQRLLQAVLVRVIDMRKQNALPPEVEIFATKVTRSQVVYLIESGLSPKEALQRLSALNRQAMQSYAAVLREKEQRLQHAPDLYGMVDLMLEAAMHLDETRAQNILDEAFFYYPVEDVCLNLLQPVLYRIGTLWAEHKISVTIEHFISNLIRTRLAHLFQSAPDLRQGPSILVGCAPKETHEIGILMLALFWRRAGLHIYYLGQMLEMRSLLQEVRAIKPGVVCLSAMTRPRVKDLAEVAREITKLEQPRPIVCFGGGAFGQDSTLLRNIKGVFLGNDAATATKRVCELIQLQASFPSQDVEHILTQRYP